MTERLFDRDSHLVEFTATVQFCQPGKHGYDVILDRTAFYPEGGGQPGDCGVLGGVTVTDTHECNGEIVHYCKEPLPVGKTLSGTIDWPRRLRLTQQHSGEHMVSGLIHAAYGYNNVGFHMGKDAVTIDFDGMLTQQQLEEIEEAVNHWIWKDLSVEILWPTREELPSYPYRSKKALTGQVRLVNIPGVDLCACCGTHVKRTGEIGLVKFLSMQKFHEGVRIEMLAGEPALAYLCGIWEQNRQVSGLLSAKPMETAVAAARMQQELNDVKFRLGQMEDRLFARRAEELRGVGDVLLFEENLEPDALRRLADAVLRQCGGRCAVFSETDEGYRYAMGQAEGDLRSFVREMNQALDGRGGGKPGFVQGSVRAQRTQIEAFFQYGKQGE